MRKLSIVIVSWNCQGYLRECLDSLVRYRRDPDVEIIVVDNASEDGSPDMLRECYPDISLVNAGENLGFARGTNVGIRRSSGRYVCLINPDVRTPDGCIEAMMRYMEQNPRVGLVGPRMLSPDGTADRSYMGTPTLWNLFCRALALDTLFPKSKRFGGFLMLYFDRSRTAEVDILNGWFWMTRTEALEEVGLLDERLFMYAEDLDWSKRFHDRGWKVVYFPEAEAVHYGGRSSARAPVRFALEMQRANCQYWKKHHGRASQGLYVGIVLLHQLIRLIAYSVLGLCRLAEWEEARFKARRSLACLRWMLGDAGARSPERTIQPNP